MCVSRVEPESRYRSNSPASDIVEVGDQDWDYLHGVDDIQPHSPSLRQPLFDSDEETPGLMAQLDNADMDVIGEGGDDIGFDFTFELRQQLNDVHSQAIMYQNNVAQCYRLMYDLWIKVQPKDFQPQHSQWPEDPFGVEFDSQWVGSVASDMAISGYRYLQQPALHEADLTPLSIEACIELMDYAQRTIVVLPRGSQEAANRQILMNEMRQALAERDIAPREMEVQPEGDAGGMPGDNVQHNPMDVIDNDDDVVVVDVPHNQPSNSVEIADRNDTA